MPVAPDGLLHGENETYERIDVETKPGDTDAILAILQDAVAATGNGTAINLKGYNGLVVDCVLSGTATVTFEITLDDTTWKNAALANIATGVVALTATATGTFYLPAGIRASQFRARVTWTSGTVTVTSLKHPR